MGKKVTIRDIARLAGVSVTTVSQILNGKGARFSKETQNRVLKLRDQYGYVPDFNARSLILRKSSSMIGVLVPDISSPFFGTFVKGVQQVAQHEKMIPLIFSANRDPELEQSYLSQMISRSIDGLIIASVTMTTATIDRLIGSRDIPYILFDKNYAQRGTRVLTDDYRGGSLAAQHLVDLGHQRLVVLRPQQQSENFTQRMKGFYDTLEKNDIHLDQEHDVVIEPLSRPGGYAATDAVLKSDATAVFAGNDDMAIGLLRGLAEHGVKVPQQLSVIGYDDIYMDEYVSPRLTTVQQPILDLGTGAAKLLLSKIHDEHATEQVRRFPVELVVRDSTAAPRAEKMIKFD